MVSKHGMLGLPKPLQKATRQVRARLPEVNFISLHYAYFITVSLLAAIVFWGSSKPLHSVSFTDALFLCLSAMTETGLNTVNLSEVNTFQQVILLLLMLFGSAITVSAFVVIVRLRAFETAFVRFKEDRLQKRAQRKQDGLSRSRAFVPRKLTRARALSEDEKTNEAGNEPTNGVQIGKRPRTQSQELSRRTEAARSAVPPNLDHRFNALDGIVEENRQTANERGRGLQAHLERPQNQCPSQSPAGRDSEHADHVEEPPPPQHISFAPRASTFTKHQYSDDEYKKVHKPFISFTGIGATNRSSIRPRGPSVARSALPPGSPQLMSPNPTLRRAATLRSFSAYDQSKASKFTELGWMSRNSQFHGLTLKEREALGGREYKCLVFLSFLVPIYLILWQGLGAIAVGAWVNNHEAEVVRQNGMRPWWAGSYMAVSAFGNSGMSLLDANMVAFQNSGFMLLTLGLFILAGNTAYPIFLRAIVWTIWRLLPDDARWREDKDTLRFLLNFPRRVYTNMFPSRQTWWLVAVLVLLNGIDWLFFEVLSIGDADIENLSQTARVLGGLFQAFAVRSGGFYVVPIPTLRLSLQFLYIIMMYISVYPVTMTIRNSNVYEERSLGVFAEDVGDDKCNHPQQSTGSAETPGTPSSGRIAGIKRRMTNFAQVANKAPERETRSYFLRQQVRAQLAHDVWFAVLAVFLILIIENSQIEADPVGFSVFNVIFEVVSAYACVGMSVGVSNNAYSFSGSWSTLSKLILILVMLRGRHRGLPVAIDHAIQLPGSKLWTAEDEDGERRLDKVEMLERAQTLDSVSQRLDTPLLQSPSVLKEKKMQQREEANQANATW